jgi:cytochrome c oxidase accessory protein FixG
VSDRATVAVGFDEDHETFRNELATVAPDGRRRWIYARKPSGRYYRARTILSWFLLAFLLGAPFVKVGGLPLMLFNVIERRFILFGIVFWPQDFYLVVLIALTVLLAIVLSTTAIGRVWCGWLCPQTIFMEMLFRKLEYAIEGSAAEQFRRNRGPWTGDRIWRSGLKHAIFFGLSFLIANAFLSYIIGADALWAIITDPPSEHVGGLIAITIFSLVFFAVFARFREQACVLACPYGRIMSSLIDRHTITVTYDSMRGEPRGKLVAVTAEGAAPRGDCIDCHQCVTVCPTGIDIRNGVQLECVNCTACMDACDSVMTRTRRPTGLIRLTSHEAVTTGRVHWLTGRVAAYITVWLVLFGTVTTLVARRPSLDVLVLRQPGTLYATLPNGDVTNFYNLQIFNRTRDAVPFEIAVAPGETATLTPLGLGASVGPHALVEGRLLLAVPRALAIGPGRTIRLVVRSRGETVQEMSTSFVGPPSARVNGGPLIVALGGVP